MSDIPIGAALKAIRNQRGMTQGDTEKRTGLLRCYLSRVENGHTVPSIPTLTQLADAYDTKVWKIIKFAEETV